MYFFFLVTLDSQCLLFSQFRFVLLSLVYPKATRSNEARVCEVSIFIFLWKLVHANVISVTVTFNDVTTNGFLV
jgi:hypothetical protein